MLQMYSGLRWVFLNKISESKINYMLYYQPNESKLEEEKQIQREVFLRSLLPLLGTVVKAPK